MSRYFTTFREAAGLVVVAAALGEGEIVVLDMGEPIRVDTLVRQMIFLYGQAPDRNIDIVDTGPRPGEKMCGELYSDIPSIPAALSFDTTLANAATMFSFSTTASLRVSSIRMRRVYGMKAGAHYPGRSPGWPDGAWWSGDAS